MLKNIESSRKLGAIEIEALLHTYIKEGIPSSNNITIKLIEDTDVKIFYVTYWYIDKGVDKDMKLIYYINTNYGWEWQYFIDVLNPDNLEPLKNL